MYRHPKTDKEKELRRLFTDMSNAQANRGKGNYWVDVDPYQSGWIRYFDLRDDVKNRRDVREIRNVLELINSRVFCKNENFLMWSYKQRKYVAIEQPLKDISEQRWESLNEKQKSFFTKITIAHYSHPKTVIRTVYRFKNPFWYKYIIEPNIIVQHKVIDGLSESRYAELRNKINRENLWPKITKAMSKSVYHGHKFDDLRGKERNKWGDVFEEMDDDQ